MSCPVSLAAFKTHLGLPAATDAERDPELTGLLNAATEHVERIIGASFDDVDPTERQLRAIKFHAAWYFEHPVGAQPQDVDGLTRVMDHLLCDSRVFTYPN